MGIRRDFLNTPSTMNAYQRQRAIAAYRAAVAFGDPDPIGFVAQAWQESRFDPNAHSSANARGEWQFIPGTAARFGINPNNPDQAQLGALKYRRAIRQYFGKHGLPTNNEALVWAGYNAGEGRAVRALNSFKETRQYVKNIEGFKPQFLRALGIDPANGYANSAQQYASDSGSAMVEPQRNTPTQLFETSQALPTQLIDYKQILRASSPTTALADALWSELGARNG